MKFILSLAILAVAAQAIQIDSESEVEVKAEASTEATAEAATETTAEASTEAQAEAGEGYNGPIVPENYDYAVHDFNLEKPFTDQDCYEKQVDIYSDQIIAIEAIRLEVLQLTQRIVQAEYDFEANAQKIQENKSRIVQNGNEALHNKSKIDVLYQDVDDVASCLSRQWDEQKTLRAVLELYCHQFTYVAHLPYQCEPILGASKPLHSVYAWPSEGNYGH